MTTRIQTLDQVTKEYMQNAFSENTHKNYFSDWKQWWEYAGNKELPATVEQVQRFLTWLSHEKGYKPATIDRKLYALRKLHTLASVEDPTKDKRVLLQLRGIKRTKSTRQRKAQPLTMDLVKLWLDTLDDSPKAKRDRAIILLGLAGAFRRSELAALQIEDITQDTKGLKIYIRRSKTDQEGAGDVIGVVWGKNGSCAVRAVLDWIQALDRESGPLFSGFFKGGKVSHEGISDRLVDRLVKELVEVIGLDPGDYSAHSLRAGLVTTAIQNGANPFHVKRHGRWKSDRIFAGYYRETEILGESNPTQFLDR